MEKKILFHSYSITKVKTRWFTILVVLLLVGCTNSFNTTSLSGKDLAAIKNVLDLSVKSELDGDLDAYYLLFTDDVVLMPRIVPAVEGLEAFRRIPLIPLLEKEMDIIRIDGHGDMAYVLFNLTIVRDIETAIKRKHKGIQILRKQANGDWLISLIIVNSAE